MAAPFAAQTAVDFHLHSSASDGDHSPEQIAAAVRKAWLSRWALTDHDTLAGWRRIATSPGLVCGVEISAGSDGREVHVIGLGLAAEHPGLTALLAGIRARRLERVDALLTRLPENVRRGLTAAEVKPPEADAVGRLHLARALARRGGVASIREAFTFHLADEHLVDASLPAFPPIAEVAAVIRAAGGVAILAHPGVYRSLEAIAALVEPLDGIEAAHAGLPEELQRAVLVLASQRNLLLSVGSDTHRIAANRRPGSIQLSPELLAPLLERLR